MQQQSLFASAIAAAEIDDPQVQRLLTIDEGTFYEVKSREIAPSKLTRTICAFANTDGGDVYLGIAERHTGGGAKDRIWDGFPNVEAANSHLQVFERYFPLGTDFQYGFLTCPGRSGLVLHIQVARTQQVMTGSDDIAYIRRGAQNLPQTGDALRRLEYQKGVVSFEIELLNAAKETITESPITLDFLRHVVPKAEPEAWLKKQALLRENRPNVAALLLYAEEPQALLPKRSGIKIYRYKTKETEGFRDVLAFDPRTVEGHLYAQVKEAVRVTIDIAESIPRIGEEGLEKIQYPTETLHEIITNALIHRDYSVADDVHIRIFDNRIEVQSPGRLPAHVTPKNILKERFARNPAIVRLLNKFPDPPNKDVGEGLNTAFEKMHQLGLKEPVIQERDNDVLVTIRHETLASPEETILKYLEANPTIRNKKAREITHVKADYQMKNIFGKMEQKGLIEQVPNTRTSNTAYRKKTPSE